MPKTSGSFKVGDSRPRKPKGAVNKSTKKMREVLAHVLDGREESIQKALDSLTGKDYIDALSKLLPFVIAKKTDVTTDDEKINITFIRNESED